MKRLFLFFSLAAVVSAGIYAYYQYNKTHTHLAGVKADITINAADLYQAFSSDENNANTLYIGKVLDISGVISNMDKEETSFKIFLETDDMLGEIQCEMDTVTDIAELKEGDQVVVRGVCSGFLTDVVVSRCVVIK
jgi:hypothetical protein